MAVRPGPDQPLQERTIKERETRRMMTVKTFQITATAVENSSPSTIFYFTLLAGESQAQPIMK